MDELPKAFIKRIVDLHGPSAREWLDGLSSRIHLLENRWQIQVSDPFQPLNYNYVASALRNDGTEAILKLGIPGRPFEQEAQCLRVFAGNGAAYLLECDAKLGAMLLERIRPGSNIESHLAAYAPSVRSTHFTSSQTCAIMCYEPDGISVQEL